MTKDDLKKKIQNATLDESIDLFRKEIEKLKINQEELNNIDNSESDYCVMVDLSNWNEEDKKELFLYTLRGINYATFILYNLSCFPIGGFNNVLKAIKGNNKVNINRKGIKWYPEHLKNKLREQGVIFDDLKVNSTYKSSYHERETYNEYNGSYAQDIENLSDQFINEVFDGDPDLSWNID